MFPGPDACISHSLETGQCLALEYCSDQNGGLAVFLSCEERRAKDRKKRIVAPWSRFVPTRTSQSCPPKDGLAVASS